MAESEGQRRREQQAERPQQQQRQAGAAVSQQPALTPALPVAEQPERVQHQHQHRAERRTGGVQAPVDDRRHPPRQQVLQGLEHIAQTAGHPDRDGERQPGAAPAAQQSTCQQRPERHVGEQVADQVELPHATRLGHRQQPPANVGRGRPFPAGERVQAGVDHQAGAGRRQGPGRTAALRGHAPGRPQNGLTTTSTTIAANTSTAASLKTRNQRWLRRLACCSKSRSSRLHTWW
ncbi:hypothetical protein X551_02208 [Methylibium sp. T29]|nr:hypothetical protein X551_02208 [Methylibium sp. T29]